MALRGLDGRPSALSRAQEWLLAAYSTVELPRAVRFYRVGPEVGAAAVEAALERCAARHPALRLELVKDDNDIWRQRFDGTVPTVPERILPRDPDGPLEVWVARATAADMIGERAGAVSAVLFGTGAPGASRVLALHCDRFALDGHGVDLLERALDAELAGGEAVAGEDDGRPATGDEPRRARPEGMPGVADALVAGSAAPPAPRDEPPAIRRAVVRYTGEELARLRDACRATRISPAVAYLAGQALLLREATGASAAVINVPVGNRATAAERLLIANLSTVVHVPIDLAGVATASDLRQTVRLAMLRAMKLRDVDARALYLALYRALPHWPPGWNTFCNVREIDENLPLRVLAPIELPLIEPTHRLPRLMVANVQLSPAGALAEWLWDAGTWPVEPGEAFEPLVERIATAAPATPLGTLAARA